MNRFRYSYWVYDYRYGTGTKICMNRYGWYEFSYECTIYLFIYLFIYSFIYSFIYLLIDNSGQLKTCHVCYIKRDF